MSKLFSFTKKLLYRLIVIFGLLWFLIFVFAMVFAACLSHMEDECLADGICPQGRFLKNCMPNGDSCTIDAKSCAVVGFWGDDVCYLKVNGWKGVHKK